MSKQSSKPIKHCFTFFPSTWNFAQHFIEVIMHTILLLHDSKWVSQEHQNMLMLLSSWKLDVMRIIEHLINIKLWCVFAVHQLSLLSCVNEKRSWVIMWLNEAVSGISRLVGTELTLWTANKLTRLWSLSRWNSTKLLIAHISRLQWYISDISFCASRFSIDWRLKSPMQSHEWPCLFGNTKFGCFPLKWKITRFHSPHNDWFFRVWFLKSKWRKTSERDENGKSKTSTFKQIGCRFQ